MNSNDTATPVASTAVYTPDQREKFELLLRQKGIVPATFQPRLECGILADLLDPRADLTKRLAVRAALGLGPLPSDPGFHTVDYGQTLEVMVAAGNYDWKNGDITPQRFPIVGEGRVEFEDTLFHFDKDISSDDAIAQIRAADPQNPWQPGKIENLLSYGFKNPEDQRKFPIIGLGSVAKVSGHRSVPYLDEDGSERSLGLGWFDGGWDAAAGSSPFAKRSLGSRLLDFLAKPGALPLGILDTSALTPHVCFRATRGFFIFTILYILCNDK